MLNKFHLLQYQDLDTSGLEEKFSKVCLHLENGNFKTVDVKKISTKGYYRAKLDNTNRLLFKTIHHDNTMHLLLLDAALQLL